MQTVGKAKRQTTWLISTARSSHDANHAILPARQRLTIEFPCCGRKNLVTKKSGKHHTSAGNVYHCEGDWPGTPSPATIGKNLCEEQTQLSRSAEQAPLQGIGKVGKVPLDCQLAGVLVQTRGVRGLN